MPEMASPGRRSAGGLEVDAVSFAYGDRLVLDGVSFTVQEGEFVAVIGPNGCGKTTLLLIIAGLLSPARGAVRVDGQRVEGPGDDRAMVFQGLDLLPWKRVVDNVALGLRYRRRDLSRSQQREIADRYLRLVGIEGFGDAFPYELSGGMQQRVRLARALAVDPAILLMDEPFSGLDAQTAQLMREELRNLVRREARTVLLVTHDLDEALFLADRVELMRARPGAIEDDIAIDLPHPRDLEAGDDTQRERYVAYRAQLWDHLRRQVETTPPTPSASGSQHAEP